MVKVSLNTFKHKFFYQILVLSIIILSIVVGVSVTSNKSKLFFNKTMAAAPPNCISWTDFYIDNCTPNSSYSNNLPACNTTHSGVTIHMNAGINATQMQLVNVDNVNLYCTDNRITWPSPVAFSTTATISLLAGYGEKKVCGRFTNSQGESKCGGMIHYVANNPSPTSTPRPCRGNGQTCFAPDYCCSGLYCAFTGENRVCMPNPTSTPPPCNPCAGEGYSCSGKSGYYCHNNCKYLAGTCPAYKTCWANANNWGCTDNCVDGTYQCSGPSCNQSLKKCVNDTWQFQRYCRCIDAECSCNAGLGICQGGCAP